MTVRVNTEHAAASKTEKKSSILYLIWYELDYIGSLGGCLIKLCEVYV